MSTKKRPFSPVDEFIKTFNEMSARYSRNELWYNYIDIFNAKTNRKPEIIFKTHCAYVTQCGIIR